MRDIFEGLTPELSDPDPVRRAQIQMKKPLPKRFYTDVTVAPDHGGHAVLLDGKTVKTPARHALVLPSAALAGLVAAEWHAQAEVIDPGTMPVTRLVNTALDAVSSNVEEVVADLLRFCGNDMLCYRADTPQELVERQAKAWDPVLAWLEETHGPRLHVTSGIMHQPQPQAAIDAFGQAVLPYRDGVSLACLHVITTLTGSAVLALALADGYLSLQQCWGLAHLDEDWTEEHWGSDDEAQARRAARFIDMQAAYNVLRAVSA